MSKAECFQRYIMKYPEKYEAQLKARWNPIKLVVLFECECNKKKENHHPDYSRWWEVYRLCRGCHNKLHPKNGRHFNTTEEIKDPVIGMIIRGVQIGKPKQRRSFLFVECGHCLKPRWVRIENGKPRNNICRDCLERGVKCEPRRKDEKVSGDDLAEDEAAELFQVRLGAQAAGRF